MSATPSRSALASKLSPPKAKAHGFLHIARHGAGPRAMYVVTYHRLDRAGPSAPENHPERKERTSLPSTSLRAGARSRPVLAEGAESLIDLLERIGVDFRHGEVRGALTDVLRFGSANIPDLWLTDEEFLEKGLVES